MEPRKEAILDALAKFMNQRSGIEFGNYGDVKAFRAEQRSIYTDLKQARVLLAAVKWRDGIDADALVKAAEGAYSGRLSIAFAAFKSITDGANECRYCGEAANAHRGALNECEKTQVFIDYVTGQYFPTEYRRAVCAVLASALWEYTREKAMPTKGSPNYREYTPDSANQRRGGKGFCDYGTEREYLSGRAWVSAGDWLRAHFRKEFGRTIADRWFS